MTRKFTLEYWIDDGWYVGQLREVPGVFSQGETFEELERNIRDAYRLMLRERPVRRRGARSKSIALPA
jgi:predicted RNase H-like HicB family nuclease